MVTRESGRHKTYVYAGLAGETAPGRTINSGLYRMAAGEGQWESIGNGLPPSPAVRAIAVHPTSPELVYAGTQEGPYRSSDHGDHWEKVDVPDHGLPVWSLLFHPRDANVMYAGYDSCEIYRSDNAGESWCQLPVSVRFPEVTMRPGANPARRVLMMSTSAGDPDQLYAAVEVGGLIRTLDGGEHWDNTSHGQYLNDDIVDMHGVLVSSLRPGTVFNISRAGMFVSSDRGDHWQHVGLEPMNEKGQVYCRGISEVPGDPKTIWLAAGSAFQGNRGALLRSCDGGMSWERVDIGFQLESTVFGLAFDQRQPRTIYCATSKGQAFGTNDGGQTWKAHPLPDGATQVYALACG